MASNVFERKGLLVSEPQGGHNTMTAHVDNAEEMFQEYAPQVYSLARRLLDSDADAEEVALAVLLQAVRRLEQERELGGSALSCWLLRTTVTRVLAARPSCRVAGGDTAQSGIAFRAESPEQRQDLELERLIATLPHHLRDPFVLVDVEGVAADEAGELLGLSVAVVRSRLHPARLVLSEALCAASPPARTLETEAVCSSGPLTQPGHQRGGAARMSPQRLCRL
jgi:RNA polymerase sigma-70 factor (ECF subfamily)